jgi:hypothetical protein
MSEFKVYCSCFIFRFFDINVKRNIQIIFFAALNFDFKAFRQIEKFEGIELDFKDTFLTQLKTKYKMWL